MFHGPSFQGLRGIGALGDDGIDGTIESLPTPGAFLDNAGQLYGWWVMATADADFLALPSRSSASSGSGRGHPTASGSRPRSASPTSTTERSGPTSSSCGTARSSHASPAGSIAGSTAIRSSGACSATPSRHLLATPMAAGYLAVEERWRDSASRELMARRYLGTPERAVYEALNPRDQRLWLLGRIAAKDAVRHSLWREGHGPLFPVEVPLADVDEGVVAVSGGPADGTARGRGHGVVDRCGRRRRGHDPRRGRRGGRRCPDRRTPALTAAPTCCDRRCRCRVTRQQSRHRSTSRTSVGPGPQRSPERKVYRIAWTSSADSESPPTEVSVLDDVRQIISDVIGEDYVSPSDIERDTSFYADLEIESIEFVALGEALQQRYGDRLDFAAWIATLEVDEIIAMTVGQLVDQIVEATR